MTRDRPFHRSGVVAAVALTLLFAGCGTSEKTFSARPVAALAPPASAWPEAFGDAAHSSPTSATGPQTANVKWKVELGGTVTPGPVVGVDGSILAASNTGVLHALDPSTGKERWSFNGGQPYGNDLSTSAAVLPDGTILWPGPQDRLYALNSSGKLLWFQQFEGFVLSPALGSNHRVYIAYMAGHLSALDVTAKGEHSLVWTVSTEANSYGSPAIGPDATIYTTAGKKLYAISDGGTEGKVRWTFTAKDEVEVSPAVSSDGTVILGTNNDVEYGLSPKGKVRWTFVKGHYSYSSPIVKNGKAYFGDHLGDLDVLDAASGRVLRRDTTITSSQSRGPVGVGVWTAPLVDGKGNIYFGTAAGHLYGFAADGTRLWDLDTGGVNASYPALTADGTLVVGGGGSTLYAIADQP